ncbi:Dos2-interacting transcription regulator of RNA-Pol-II-domain-containing protein [Rostrohypoxylon terebratum]|nr:Dos2-interacting transcription regulator of RNA-Pol-II-domain-containing protein [Rostrohypoxylon terebratum]
MANIKFEDLALQYVLSDESDKERQISEKAAKAIEEATNTRITLGQWVASINRWIQPTDDTAADDNIIARAKALDFLATTLGVLRERSVSLTADQVKLLVTFFGSLFSSDHRAGVTASAKALNHLVRMKSFQPNLGDDIITNVCRLGEDFKLQAPATRLELYDLFLELLQDPAVASDLEYRHGNTCGFITNLLDLCRNERDPQNLMKWFATLKIFLQTFSPSEDVVTEVFKTFSAYFPISLRATAAPSGITADDLKSAVRSCFSAHHRVASHAIPYLLNKLDQGGAVTVAVKVDILQTIDACVVQYQHPKQSVVPFVNQIWSSLKYEVRNGEIPDTIKSTLKVIRSITTRLDDDELKSFLSSAWRDLVDDLSNPTYIAQAGRLLVAVTGASFQSFSTMTSQAIPSIQTTLKQSQSSSHKQELVTLLNSILAVRSLLVPTLKDNTGVDKSSNLLKDDLFGDYLFSAVYLPLWEEISDGQGSVEQVGLLKKIMEGFAALVAQQSSDASSSRQLCSASTCEKIFGWLAGPSIVNPLESREFSEGIIDDDANQEIRVSAIAALKDAVPLYPPAFQMLLQQYLTSLTKSYWHHLAPEDLPLEIKLVANTLCEVGCSDLLGKQSSLSNTVSLVNVLLEGLLWMLSKQSPPKYWTPFICSIHLCIIQSLNSLSSQAGDSTGLKPQNITKEWLTRFTKTLVDAGAPQIDLNKAEPSSHVASLIGQDVEGSNARNQLLAYFIFVVEQLYRRFTDSSATRVLAADEDICLHQIGLTATSVVRALSEDEQKALGIGNAVFTLFKETRDGGDVPKRDFSAELAYAAPLSMGILQGLYPGVLSPEDHLYALKTHCTILASSTESRLGPTRATLDMSLTILSNKLRVENKEYSQVKVQIQQILIDTLTNILNEELRPEQDEFTNIRIFRRILHFLAGDVARFRSIPKEQNALLKMVCDRAPLAPRLGRQLASNFQVLASPKECLKKENHAIEKRLSGEWLYFQAVQPYLKECFPNSGLDEAATVNRTVAIFAILKHLKYEQYASDIGQIVRICICSLSTLEAGIEMESCLSVLLQILEKDPNKLKEHLSDLIPDMIGVYETARKMPQSMGPRAYPTPKAEEKGRVLCRKFTLEFFQKLPQTYETQYIVPHRQKLLRPLSKACGDPVREIRRTALAARKAWEALA